MPTSEVLAIIGVGGMGVAVARRMGAGRVVVLGDVNTTQVASVATQLTDDGHHVVTGHVDVTSQESVTEFAGLAASCGRVSSVVHTAGLSPQQASAEVVLAVDLLGVALTLEVFEDVIAPGGAGVVIASMAGHFQPPIPPDVERQLATVPALELLSLPACGSAAITSSEAAYPFAKRANQLRVAATASHGVVGAPESIPSARVSSRRRWGDVNSPDRPATPCGRWSTALAFDESARRTTSPPLPNSCSVPRQDLSLARICWLTVAWSRPSEPERST